MSKDNLQPEEQYALSSLLSRLDTDQLEQAMKDNLNYISDLLKVIIEYEEAKQRNLRKYEEELKGGYVFPESEVEPYDVDRERF